jgi:outer membrane protein TolC
MNLAMLVLCAAWFAGGDDTRRTLPLSSREAVSLSLNHNLDIEIARYQPWIESQNVYAALGTFDHVLYGSFSDGRDVTPGLSSLSGATRLQGDATAFTMGLRKTLPFGPSYDFFFTNDRIESNNAFLLLNPGWSQTAGGTVTVPLLRGMGQAAKTATLVVARHSRNASVDLFEKSLSDSVYQVIQAYWDLVFAIENRKVKGQSLEVATRLLEDTRKKLDRGLAARTDVTQADAGVAAQQEGILTAEAAALNAADRLKRLVDPSLLRQEVLIVPIETPRSQAADLDERLAVEQSMESALARRPELRQVRTQIESQDATIAKSANDLLPQVDLSGTGLLNGSDETFRAADRETRSGEFYNFSALLVFELPLERSAAKGAFHRAELEKRRLRLQQLNLENQALVEVHEAVRAIKTNEKRIEATRRARILAQEQMEGELARNEHGLSTTFRVLDVQEDLALARTNELKALIDYNLSGHKLQQVTGEILERNGILLKETLQPRLAPADR